MASPSLFRVNILWSLLKTIKAVLPACFSTNPGKHPKFPNKMRDFPYQNEVISLFTMALKSNIILIENFTLLTFAGSNYDCMRS